MITNALDGSVLKVESCTPARSVPTMTMPVLIIRDHSMSIRTRPSSTLVGEVRTASSTGGPIGAPVR